MSRRVVCRTFVQLCRRNDRRHNRAVPSRLAGCRRTVNMAVRLLPSSGRTVSCRTSRSVSPLVLSMSKRGRTFSAACQWSGRACSSYRHREVSGTDRGQQPVESTQSKENHMPSSPVNIHPKVQRSSSDTRTLGTSLRQHIEAGAVTSGDKKDRENSRGGLSDTLASRIVCVFPYQRHVPVVAGSRAVPWQPGFLSTPIRKRSTLIA